MKVVALAVLLLAVIASAAAADTTTDAKAVTEVDCTEEEEAAGVATTGHNCRKHKESEDEADDEEDEEDDEEDDKDGEGEKPLKVPIPMAEIHDPWRLKPVHSFFKCAGLLEPTLVSRCEECFRGNLPAPWEVIGFQANNKQCRVGHQIDTSMPDPPIVRFAQLNLDTNQIEALQSEAETETEAAAETEEELELDEADEEADEADEEADVEEADEEADEEGEEELTDEEAEEEAEEEDESDEEVTEFLEVASQELTDKLHAFRTEAQKHL